MAGKEYEIFKRELDNVFNEMQGKVLELLSYVGDEAVNNMRKEHDRNWIDRTGKLRSSCGYCIAYGNEIKKISSFESIKEGHEGSSAGAGLAKKIALENSNGNKWCLVLVAGMEYASYVQNIHGRDVIEGASIQAEELIKELVSEFNK